MATMKDVAEKLNISRCTVSNILNKTKYSHNYRPETVELVWKTAAEMGVAANMVARSLRTGRSDTIAMIVPDINNAFFIRLVQEVEMCASEKGYSFMIYTSDRDVKKERAILAQMNSRMVDGVIVRPASMNESLRESYPFKIVLIDYWLSGNSTYPTVKFDEDTSSAKMGETLLKKGARKFLYIVGSHDKPVEHPRFVGFCETLRKSGIDPETSVRVIHGITPENTCREVKAQIKEGWDFDGILCATGHLLYGALTALKEEKYDVKSIGAFEKVPGARLSGYDVDIINHREKEMAREAFESLMDLIEGREVGDKVIGLEDGPDGGEMTI